MPIRIAHLKKQGKDDCKGCNLEKLRKETCKVIHEDKDDNGFILNYAINPEVDGHLVVQPRFHVEQLSDLCEKQAKRLMEIIWASCNALDKLCSPEKIYVYSFNEAKGYHLHVHIKPKVGNISIKGPCFVNWKDPKIEDMLDAIKKEKNKKRQKELERAFKKHHEKVANRIKEDGHIRKLKNEKTKK